MYKIRSNPQNYQENKTKMKKTLQIIKEEIDKTKVEVRTELHQTQKLLNISP